MQVASYNIHRCIGRDRRLDARRIAAVLIELDADIVALQEVDARHHPDFYLDQWEFLAEATGCECIQGISLRTHRNVYGNALLTRHPVKAVRLHDISVPAREPRGLIDVDIAAPMGLLRVLATHFGLGPGERRRQSDHVAQILEDQSSEASGTLLLGDFNEWHGRIRSISSMIRLFPDCAAPPTFPARYPLFALDRILARGGPCLTDVAVHRSALARIASDHLPVVGTLSWPDMAAAA